MTPGPGALLTEVAILEEVLQVHARELSADNRAYRHRGYRVLNLCVAQTSLDAAVVEKAGRMPDSTGA